MTETGADEVTLSFYNDHAADYAERSAYDTDHAILIALVEKLPEGAAVLDLGCGGGWAAAEFASRGFNVTAVDGAPGIAAEAAARTGLDVKVMRFEDLADRDAYDLVWASCSLHHAPRAALPGILNNIAAALRSGGLFAMGVKSGEGEARDRLDRFYAYYDEAELTALLHGSGLFDPPEFSARPSSGYDGTPCRVVWAVAQKAA